MADLDESQAALDSAFASGRDRGADTAAPEPKQEATPAPEPKVEAEPKAETDKPDGEPKQYRDPETGRFVPLTELKTERSKRQEEARLRAEAENRAQRLEAELAEARRYAERFQQPQQQQFAQPQQQQFEVPDPITDPQGYQQYVVQQAQTLALSERLNMSQMMAEEKFGSETVKKALDAAAKAGVMKAFITTRHPYAELVTWYNKQEAMARIGDPTDFEKRVREEERRKVLEELKKGSGAQQQRFPGTLADTPGSGSQAPVALSDQQLLDQAFAPSRKRTW